MSIRCFAEARPARLPDGTWGVSIISHEPPVEVGSIVDVTARSKGGGRYKGRFSSRDVPKQWYAQVTELFQGSSLCRTRGVSDKAVAKVRDAWAAEEDARRERNQKDRQVQEKLGDLMLRLHEGKITQSDADAEARSILGIS